MRSSVAKSYPELLSRTRPEVVHDEALNEHFIALLRELVTTHRSIVLTALSAMIFNLGQN